MTTSEKLHGVSETPPTNPDDLLKWGQEWRDAALGYYTLSEDLRSRNEYLMEKINHNKSR